MTSKLLPPLLLLLLLTRTVLAALPTELVGENLGGSGSARIQTVNKTYRGSVVVFLSAKCPCSDSHISELKNLSEKYKEFQFVGIHSNVDEDPAMAKKYFMAQELPFPVLQDDKAVIADAYKALKTPHAYVLSPEGQIVFQGGVTDSSHAKGAKVHYLDDALVSLNKNEKVKSASVRTLGCAILREKNTW